MYSMSVRFVYQLTTELQQLKIAGPKKQKELFGWLKMLFL